MRSKRVCSLRFSIHAELNLNSRRCCVRWSARLGLEMPQDLLNDPRVFNGGHQLQHTPTMNAVFQIELEHALQPLRPAQSSMPLRRHGRCRGAVLAATGERDLRP